MHRFDGFFDFYRLPEICTVKRFSAVLLFGCCKEVPCSQSKHSTKLSYTSIYYDFDIIALFAANVNPLLRNLLHTQCYCAIMGKVIKMLGIYIHIPFCLRKCPYCAFYSKAYNEQLIKSYVSALIRNIKSYKPKQLPADTVYFGGGTPSLLSVNDVRALISALSESFKLSLDCEITLEANPSSVDYEKLLGYRMAGVNRISFGVQSANDDELRLLGRLHSFAQAKAAVETAKSAGFENISCDLMIGTPNQTMASLNTSCKELAALGIPHISCYMLKIEEGTAFDCERVKQSAAGDDLMADMYLALCSELAVQGYTRYEISNFSKPGYESRHNMKYWLLKDYLGFGPSAHSYFEGQRFYVTEGIDDYISSDVQTIVIEDSSPDRLEEYIMLSLRLKSGLSISKINSLGGSGGEVLRCVQPFINNGLMEQKGDSLSLTDSGALVSNTLIVEVYTAAIGENR